MEESRQDNLSMDVPEMTKKIQLTSLGILRDFLDFSHKNKINYCALGGTVLGAVRHQGFIPWDDDIDIGLPRPDYEKLILLADSYPYPYKIECMEISELYVTPFIKIFDTRTTATENLVRPLRRGIWIDVFPLDGTFRNPLLRKWHTKLTQKLIRYLVHKNKSFPKGARSPLLGRVIPKYALVHGIRVCSRLIGFYKADYFVNMLGVYGQREVMRKEVLVDFGVGKFCGLDIRLPRDTHKYLQNLYGDYMSMPAVEKRKSHHDFIELNLDVPYESSKWV